MTSTEPDETVRSDLLAGARSSYASLRWDEAYRGFHDAGDAADLAASDLAALADAAWWLGHTDESLALSEQVYRRHLHGERVPAAARLAIEIGFLWLLRGEPTIGSGWVSRAARLLAETPECAEQGYLLYLDAVGAMGSGDLDQAIVVARRMRQLGDRYDDATLGAVGLVHEGVATLKQGRVADGLALVDEAMLAVRAGAVDPSWAGNLYCQLMTTFFELADIRRARAWTEATERWCDQHSNAAMFVGICRVHRAQLLHLDGAWHDAQRHAAQACRDLADMNVEVVAAGHYEIGQLCRVRDDRDGAEAAYCRAHQLGRDPQPGLALLRLAQGRHAQADAAIRAALAAADQPLPRAPLLVAQVDIAEAVDDPSLATQAAGELTRIAETFATDGLIAAARQAAGTARLTAGEPDRALPLLREACTRWRALGIGYEVARVRARIGRALEEVGDADTAAREFEAATTTFAELGAAHDLRTLQRTRQGTNRPLGAPGQLSAREAEVLGWVAAGRTNRQIGSVLHLSERTVERHLSNIFTKLEVSSRTEAAGVAFAHGLTVADDR
jgi:DNA-binding CsgD family transcriptional regulator